MNRFTLPIIATALITISPFLTTFENGQDITRGLFDFSILTLLLVFAHERSSVGKVRRFKLCILAILLFFISVLDLQNLLSYKGWPVSWRISIPIVTCFIALLLIKAIKPLSWNGISIFLFVILILHFYLYHLFPSQPLLEFPVAKWLARTTPNPDWLRNNLTENFKQKNNVTDSVTITKYHVDTTRSNVIILVESWGIPMDSTLFKKELNLFNETLVNRGVHFRMYSRTRTAEREDLLDSAWQDSTTRRRDSLFIPNRFVALGYKTAFLFGGDSTIQWRYKYIRNIGFQETFWTDSTTTDVVMAAKIDSILSQLDSAEHFIAWTTRDTRFPISEDPVETEKLYYERLFGTLQIVADLAKKHPDVRFVVQGDHEPILSPLEFQRKFYRRWVPFVVLN